jgi:hypothetical protein
MIVSLDPALSTVGANGSGGAEYRAGPLSLGPDGHAIGMPMGSYCRPIRAPIGRLWRAYLGAIRALFVPLKGGHKAHPVRTGGFVSRCARIFPTTAGSLMPATTRTGPPQPSQLCRFGLKSRDGERIRVNVLFGDAAWRLRSRGASGKVGLNVLSTADDTNKNRAMRMFKV